MASKSLALSASALIVLGAISKILGFVREQAIASSLGAGYLTDSYVLAVSITGFAYIALNTILASAFLPVYSSYRAKGNTESAALFARTVARVTFVACAIIAGLGSISAPVLVTLIAPNCPPNTAALASSITAVLFPAMAAPTIMALFTAMLNSHSIFAIPGLAPIVQNVLTIAGVVYLTSTMSVWGLVVGSIGGMVAGVAVQLPALRNTPLLSRGASNLKDESMRAMLGMSGPLLASALFGQAYTIVERSLASALQPGSMAALSFALRVVQLPNAIMVMAICAVVFPRLSLLWGQRNRDELGRTVVSTATLISAVVMPAAVAFAALATPIVRVVYQRGAFDEAAVALTASSLMFYSGGILFQALSLLFTRAFYAMQDSRTPLFVSVAGATTAILLSYTLVGPMAHNGLALANSVAGAVSALLLGGLLYRRIDGTQITSLLLSHAKIFGSSLVMAIAARVMLVRLPVTGGGMASAARFGLVVAIGGACYIVCIIASGVLPVRSMIQKVAAMLGPRLGRGIGA